MLEEDEIGKRTMRRRNNGRSSETPLAQSQDTGKTIRSSRSRSRARRQVTTSDAVAGGTVVVRTKRGEDVLPQTGGTTIKETAQRVTRSQAVGKREDAAADGVTTRSMARRQKQETHGGVSVPLPQCIPLPTRGRGSEPPPTRIPPPPPPPAAVSPPPPPPPPPVVELSPRMARRSPQFNYDRFIPARSATDLRMYEQRAGSPTFSRRATHIEHRAQVDEANRTYDALLRA
ncbi:hypothetical protein IWW38_003654, partial [Coemansia aciculifera]